MGDICSVKHKFFMKLFSIFSIFTEDFFDTI